MEIWENADDEKLFIELSFCLFTPQSNAKSCWKAVEILLENDLIKNGTCSEISGKINLVRFRNNKASYLVEARGKFFGENKESLRAILVKHSDAVQKREWLVSNIKGMGYKEASHFLRNIGLGEDIAILDRHILKNMVKLGIIGEIPKTLSKANYLYLETLLKEFSGYSSIPMGHLDFVLWYKEAGDVFK
jgi:N-glycosylase/DNA lyase